MYDPNSPHGGQHAHPPGVAPTTPGQSPSGGFGAPPPGQGHSAAPHPGQAQSSPAFGAPAQAQPQPTPPHSAVGYGQAPGPSANFDPQAQVAKLQAALANRKGFLSSLFDFSFTEFVSPAVLKVLYGVFLFGLGMSVFFLLYVWYQTLFQTHWRTGEWDPELDVFFGSLFAYPLFVFVYLLLGRVIFERGILAFRQYELTRELVELMRDRTER